jgi:hypothetical protein
MPKEKVREERQERRHELLSKDSIQLSRRHLGRQLREIQTLVREIESFHREKRRKRES